MNNQGYSYNAHGVPPHPPQGSQPYAYMPPPGQAASVVMYTDDAGTKLSDRVRRQCYNCRSTDTSTWRRAILTPGKILCNRCGLFERTHSTSRPSQLPRSRQAPAASTTHRASPMAPPPSSSASRSRLPQQGTSSQQLGPLPPHHSNHPSIATLGQQQQPAAYSYPSATTMNTEMEAQGPDERQQRSPTPASPSSNSRSSHSSQERRDGTTAYPDRSA